MPITPPQPPVQPPVVQPPVVPPVQQPVDPVFQPSNNEVNVEDTSTSNSTSEANNTVAQSGSLQNFQVNNNNQTSYYGYANGVSIPGTSIYGNLSAVNNSWDWDRTNVVATVGIRHTFGGQAKKLAEQSVRNDNLGKTLSICKALGLYNGEVEIDYELMPELRDCSFIKQKTVVAQTPVNEIAILKQQIKDQQALLQRMQEENGYRKTIIRQKYQRVQVGG